LKALERSVENFISEILSRHDATAFHVANIQKIAHTAVVVSNQNQDRTSQTPSPMLSPSPLTVTPIAPDVAATTAATVTPEISESLLMPQTVPTAPEYGGFPSYATRNVKLSNFYTNFCRRNLTRTKMSWITLNRYEELVSSNRRLNK
jgi:hypothetical protein